MNKIKYFLRPTLTLILFIATTTSKPLRGMDPEIPIIAAFFGVATLAAGTITFFSGKYCIKKIWTFNKKKESSTKLSRILYAAGTGGLATVSGLTTVFLGAVTYEGMKNVVDKWKKS